MLHEAHRELEKSGALEPVLLGGQDERTWLDCDLASLAENRLGDASGPLGLSPARRAEWQSRATTESSDTLAVRSQWERCYWLKDGRERVGTVALGTVTTGSTLVRLSSLYVMPHHRGRGAGSGAMRRIRAALAKRNYGLRLDTHWTWPNAVRLYQHLGMWIYMWKHTLVFFWHPATPDPRIDVGAESASLSVTAGGEDLVLARASRAGERLVMDDRGEEPERLSRDTRLGLGFWHASSTLSLALAVRGWPLVRSPKDWSESRWADGGTPESLAYKITIWEAWDRKLGFSADTPRIPGLEYPTWDELQARWDAESVDL